MDKLKALYAKDLFTANDVNSEVFGYRTSDGPNGVRYVTEKDIDGECNFCLPSTSLLANSFNEDICFDYGKMLASQCIEKNVDVLLAPGVNIKKTPLCGRNFEYFSEDPYLIGVEASNVVKGIQSLGIAATVKHFCCNNREIQRFKQSSEIDYFSLRQTYTRAFEMIIKNADPWVLMCSYNPVNGINMAENKFMLDDLLRKKLNYKNVIISDWGAVHDRNESLNASLDVEFPYNKERTDKFYQDFADNKVDLNKVEQSYNRVKDLCKKIKDNQVKRIPLSQSLIEEKCLKTIYQGSVLLKNNDDIFPLKGNKVLIVGKINEMPFISGGGSANIKTDRKIDSLSYLLEKQDLSKEILYANAYNIEKGIEVEDNFNDAYLKASKVDDVVILVGNSDIVESEGYDRKTIKLNSIIEELINKVAKINKNVLVVIESGSCIDVSNFTKNVKGILLLGYAGNMVNVALANMLLGKNYPSGRLAETWPIKIENTPTKLNKGNNLKEYYKEGIFVGYRHYDKKNIKVAYPFGYGLSVASFSYDNFKITNTKKNEYNISFNIINNDSFDDYEVIQLYLQNDKKAKHLAKKDLIGFKKVLVKANSKQNVTFKVKESDFYFFDEKKDMFKLNDLNTNVSLLISKNANEILYSYKIKIEK